MIFLIEYDRPTGVIVTYRTFEDRERDEAANARLKIELTLNRNRINHEVVLLDAENEEALRRTHRRYFQNARQIATPSGS